MKDTKFIELLNLYLDHQISEHEAAQLEAEVRRSPERLRLYRQYCRMQKACVMLAESSREEAPVQAKIAPVARRRFAAVPYYIGLAAAACIAMVVLTRSGDVSVAEGQTLQASATESPGAAAVAEATPAFAMPAARTEPLRTVFTAQALAQFDHSGADTPVFPTGNLARFGWMNEVELQPVSFDPVIFGNRRDLPAERHVFRSQRPFEATVEMTAFRFQK